LPVCVPLITLHVAPSFKFSFDSSSIIDNYNIIACAWYAHGIKGGTIAVW
jgi:hypothetical protein